MTAKRKGTEIGYSPDCRSRRRKSCVSVDDPVIEVDDNEDDLTMEQCSRCQKRSVVLDPGAGILVCTSCGIEQSPDNFQSQVFTSNGCPTGTIIQSISSSPSLDRKIYRAEIEVKAIATRIGLSDARTAEVSSLVSKVTNGQFGAGDWFTVLVAACVCITMRNNRLPLPIIEAAASIGRDAHEVGRMMTRVCNFLDLPQLPEFDMFQHLQRILRNPNLLGTDDGKLEEMLKQGRFLLQCSVKWFLSTGRHPLPLIAAVVMFIAEMNNVDANLEEIAGYSYARPATCQKRKKELKEALIQVAKKILPWGEDVTSKNIVCHAPFLLKFMERRSEKGDLDFGLPVTSMCSVDEDVSKHSSATDDHQLIKNAEELKICVESLKEAYRKAVVAARLVDPAEEAKKSLERMKNRNIVSHPSSLSYDKSPCPRNTPSLDEILRRDVGYDAPPPSFTAGLKARETRKEKIASAKQRISKITKQKSDKGVGTNDHVLPVCSKKGKKRQEQCSRGIDMEDLIIELLLLHRVTEEEIEQGHYNRLLDLYVFTPLKE